MTDEQLATFLGLDRCTPGDREKILRSITPLRRATYERLAKVEAELNVWQCGLGPKPRGVLVDGVRSIRRKRRQRRSMIE